MQGTNDLRTENTTIKIAKATIAQDTSSKNDGNTNYVWYYSDARRIEQQGK